MQLAFPFAVGKHKAGYTRTGQKAEAVKAEVAKAQVVCETSDLYFLRRMVSHSIARNTC